MEDFRISKTIMFWSSTLEKLEDLRLKNLSKFVEDAVLKEIKERE